MNAEQELAAVVVDWLRAEGWEVYQEVTTGSGRADIVAVRGPVRWAIETKTSLNLAVMDQAADNVAWFHYSSIAVPAPANSSFASPRNWKLAQKVAGLLGFGILRVLPESGARDSRVFVDDRCTPRFNRRPGLVDLHEAQKTEGQAGSNGGGYYTPFRATCERLVWYVTRRPGLTLKEAVRNIRHHYASEPSAVQSLAKMIRQQVIPLRLEHGKLYLPETPPTP